MYKLKRSIGISFLLLLCNSSIIFSQIWIPKHAIDIGPSNSLTFSVVDSTKAIVTNDFGGRWILDLSSGEVRPILPEIDVFLRFPLNTNNSVYLVRWDRVDSYVLKADLNLQRFDTLLKKPHYLTNVGGIDEHILVVGSVEMGFPVDELHHFSFDGGKTWRIDTMTNFRSACITHLSAKRWLCGTAKGVVAQTLDSGKSWTRYQTPTDQIIQSIRVFNDTVFVESNFHRFFSIDSMQTWIELTNKPTWLYSKINNFGSYESIVGSSDSIYFSTNHGISFIGEPITTNKNFFNFNVSCTANGDCYALVYNRNVNTLLKREKITSCEHENQKDNTISISPNPASTHVSIRIFIDPSIPTIDFVFNDVLGNKFYKTVYLQGNYSSGWNNITLPVYDIPSGMYMLQIKNNQYKKESSSIFIVR